MISALPSTPESGSPIAIDFATVIRSGSTPECSTAKKRPGAGEPGLHLVDDEEDAVAVADLAQALQELGRRRDEAAFALDGLDDDRRDVLGRHERHEGALEGGSASSVDGPR